MISKSHSKRVKRISEKLGVPESVVNLIIKEYFNAMLSAMKDKRNIYVRGFFKLIRKG